MPKILSNELTGRALDWAVTSAVDGFEPDLDVFLQHHDPQGNGLGSYCYGTNPVLLERVAEREKLSVIWNEPTRQWIAFFREGMNEGYGETRLQAQARALAMMKLGEVVKVPEEVL